MYLAYYKGDLIGITDDEITARIFEEDNDGVRLYKMKDKKFYKKFTESEYINLWLVRYGDRYIPSGKFDVLSSISSSYTGELNYCKSILSSILGSEILPDNKSKHIAKTIKILDELIEDSNTDMSLDMIEEIESLDNEYRIKCN